MVVDNITLHYYAMHGVSGDRDSWYSNPALLCAHYNYTGRLGDRGTVDDAVNVGISGPRVAALFLCVLIALENALALVVLNRLRAPAYLCLSNLALADLLAATSYGANVALSGERTLQLSPQAWLAREGASFVCLSAAVFGLLAVAGQRGAVAGAVRSARLPRRAVLRRRAVAIMAGCWALALLLGTAPGLGWNCLGDLNECSTVFPLYAKSFVGFCISLLSAVLVAVVVLYLRLYRLVQQSGRRVSVTRRSVSILRTLLVILGVFILCWAPIFILLLTDAASCGRACPALFKADYIIAFAVLNSAINPILAAAASQDIRRAYRSLFCLKRTEEPDSNLPTFTGTRSLSEIGDAHINNVSLDPGNAHNTPGCLKICLLAANRCCLPWLRPSAHPHPAAVTNSQGIALVLGTPSQCKC